MAWSPQQEFAIKAVSQWLKDPSGNQIFRLFGFAGTGKTTLAKELAAKVKGDVLYATFTGKAALVLRKKGCDEASTIHSLIYKVKVDPETGKADFILNPDSPLATAALLVIDEVSMVGAELAKDLLSFGVRVLVLGDPAQLPPVKDQGFFINCEPDVMLTEVHRQAEGNPIIRMSMDVREGRGLSVGAWGESLVVRRNQISRDQMSEHVLSADQLICGVNKTRTSFNQRIRELKGLAGRDQAWHPAIGDRLICLRNNREKGLFNGGIWDAEKVRSLDGKIKMQVKSLDEARDPLPVTVFPQFFNGTEHTLEWQDRRNSDEFTFGWAITCHKSQGSQWDNPIVFDESGVFGNDQSKWLYTAITRAAERVTVVV